MRVATKSKREPAPVVDGLEAHVDRARELRRQIDSAQTELSLIEDQLRAEGDKRMLGLESRGEVVSHLELAGTEGSAKVGRRNKWKQIAPSAEAHMRQVLGPYFDRLFHKTCTAKLKPAMAAKLVAAAKMVGLDLSLYMKISEHVAPVNKYLQTRGALRPELPDHINSELDELEDQIRNDSTVTYK
jgi:hypothetical protein